MDTSARRYIWEMLKDYKNDRIVILTTHFMDEAEFLSDRIHLNWRLTNLIMNKRIDYDSET